MQTQKKTEHGWFLSILTIFQNEVFETILKFIVDEEVVDKPLLLGGCLGLHHDGEGGAVVLGEEMLRFLGQIRFHISLQICSLDFSPCPGEGRTGSS